ncbi:MAG: glycosyltransferase family 4 protein [Candidatus Methanoperedens sp.]|nr:glycosyltransferase family 4 protein [Candidatus Methanoperedens sp.]
MKIAFVVPRYGTDFVGGAETICREVAEHLRNKGVDVSVLTTCALDHITWDNSYKPGDYVINSVPVKRFKVRDRDKKLYDELLTKISSNQILSKDEQISWINNGVNSDEMYQYITNNINSFDFFIFIPYLFGTSYNGSLICPDKSILIPCLHDENFAYLNIFKEMFEGCKGINFNSFPEKILANRLYNIKNKSSTIIGTGFNTESGDKNRFKQMNQIYEDFILYSGRIEEGKNAHLLVEFVGKYNKLNNTSLKLVLMGIGNMTIPSDIKKDVIKIGFKSGQEKFDAYAAAAVLCQPSINESFSIVIMESWLCETPVLVHENCAVTKYHCIESNGGLYFKDYNDFEGCINFLLKNPLVREKMGKNGQKYVLKNYNWDRIAEKYLLFWRALSANTPNTSHN